MLGICSADGVFFIGGFFIFMLGVGWGMGNVGDG